MDEHYRFLRRPLAPALAADPALRATVLDFLRVDADCFRSGYAAASIVRALSSIGPTEEEVRAQQDMVLRRLPLRPRRELRTLANARSGRHDPAFAIELARRAGGRDQAARNARFVLDRLEHPNGLPLEVAGAERATRRTWRGC